MPIDIDPNRRKVMDNTKQMNDYWHIPRASLASSSSAASTSAASYTSLSNHSHKLNFNLPPNVAKHTTNNINGVSDFIHKQLEQQQMPRYMANNFYAVPFCGQRENGQEIKHNMTVTTINNTGTKRGSRSSQGSSDSNNSTNSATSGSFLLTAANLERFAEIHRKQQNHNHETILKRSGIFGIQCASISNHYNANLVNAISTSQPHQQNNGNAIIRIDLRNFDFIQKTTTEDLDNISLASSMHFTILNGDGGPSMKKPKRGLCDRGRQVTVLIISMSLIFLFLIMGMVYALEMRAREMPHS